MSNEYSTLEQYHGTLQGNTETVLTVDASGGGDYTTIREALAAAVAATPTYAAPYKIYIRNGTYNEIQLDGVDYVTVEGESRTGVVMVSDGLRTDVDPVSGQRYVDMDQSTKHGWKIDHYMTMRNMTIQVNDVKYCIHSDAQGAYRFNLENVHLQHANGTPLGCGCRPNEIINATDCIFEKVGENVADSSAPGAYGIYWHNGGNQVGPTRATISNCQFINCGVASLVELGSDYVDLVMFINPVTDDTKGFCFRVLTLFWDGGAHTAPEIPYCINLLTIGGTFPTPINYVELDRPNLMNHVSIE